MSTSIIVFHSSPKAFFHWKYIISRRAFNDNNKCHFCSCVKEHPTIYFLNSKSGGQYKKNDIVTSNSVYPVNAAFILKTMLHNKL